MFAKAEEQGDCGTATGDAGSIGGTVDLFVGDMDGNLFPSDPPFAPFETVVVNAP